MGAFLSKFIFNETSRPKDCQGSVEKHNSKATPKHQTMPDPRSPSSQISRTPIQVEVPKLRNVEKKISSLAVVPDGGFGSETPVGVTSVKHQRISALRLQEERDPRSPSYGIARTPLQLAMDGGTREQPVEQVQEILMYEGQAEVPLIKNSPREATNPSCARIMGLPPQGAQMTDSGQQQQLDADMSVFLFGLSKALSLTETQQQKVMKTYHGRDENSVPAKKLKTSKQMCKKDDAPPLRPRVPLSSVNSPHQMWRGPSSKGERRHLTTASENIPPSVLHDDSKIHSVWDQDATVII